MNERPFIRKTLMKDRYPMRLDPHEEKRRWLLQTRQKLDDAKYILEG